MGDTINNSEIGSPINYKILIFIIFLGILVQVYISSTSIEVNYYVISFLYASGALGSSIFSMWVSKKYRKSKIFGRSYFVLGLAFLMLFIGDSVYNYYDLVLGIDPFPSIADVFFLSYTPLIIFHLVSNIKFFKQNIDTSMQNITAILIVVAILIVAIYIAISYSEFVEFDNIFFLGLAFVATDSIILTLAIFGVLLFRNSILGTAWLLLTLGIFIFTVSDIWYYYTEELGTYSDQLPIVTLWLVSFMIIIYSLYKHRKII